MELARQTGIVDPALLTSKQFLIIGAGSVGSLLTFCLAKMGVNNISVIDYDKVEAANIPNQLYRVKDIGQPKVNCLKEIIKGFTGTDIIILNHKIEEDTELKELALNTIVILTVDNIETRKIVYNKIKELPLILIDCRMGGEGYSIQIANLENEEERVNYEKSLEGEFKELPCGQKAISYSIMNLASETTNLIKKILKEEPYERIVKREMPVYSYLIKSGKADN